MAVQSPFGGSWVAQPRHAEPASAHPGGEDRAERIAGWLVIYLTALLTSLALGGSAWALGLVG